MYRAQVQVRVISLAGGQVTVSGDTFGCHDWANATGAEWEGARDAAERPVVHRTAPAPVRGYLAPSVSSTMIKKSSCRDFNPELGLSLRFYHPNLVIWNPWDYKPVFLLEGPKPRGLMGCTGSCCVLGSSRVFDERPLRGPGLRAAAWSSARESRGLCLPCLSTCTSAKPAGETATESTQAWTAAPAPPPARLLRKCEKQRGESGSSSSPLRLRCTRAVAEQKTSVSGAVNPSLFNSIKFVLKNSCCGFWGHNCSSKEVC